MSKTYTPRYLKEDKKKKRVLPKLIMLLFAAVFLVAGFMVARYYLTAAKEQKTVDELIALVEEEQQQESRDIGTVGDKSRSRFEILHEKNADYFGWLSIDGTAVNYPVMFTPGDGEYYLHRDFYGDYSESGSLFMDGGCDPNGGYYLIYGHHMNSGAMFAALPQYADRDFLRDHPTVTLETEKGGTDYTVFAAFYAEIFPDDDTEHYHYYDVKRLPDEAGFKDYIAHVRSMAVYDTGIIPTYGDKIIALSTCNYHTDNGRFVIVAVKKK